jgi:SRSO17 transposase
VYAARFHDLFTRMAQRRGFRAYLAGLLAPRDRNKTLTALAGAEPVTGAQHPAVQRLQFFLSESRWDPELINARRLELLLADPSTAPHGGVLVIDDSGDRKDGVKTAHVGHQWLGRYGKTDSGVVTVITVWADERLYYPVHAVPYTPAGHFARGRAIRRSGPSCRLARTWRSGPRPRGSCSARWPRTARTGTRTGSAANWPRPGCRS